MYDYKWSCPSDVTQTYTHKRTSLHDAPLIHPSLPQNQERLYLCWNSATNLETICWDILSFHVFQLSQFLVLWKSLPLCTCASILLCIPIVFEVNPNIVWLLAVLSQHRGMDKVRQTQCSFIWTASGLGQVRTQKTKSLSSSVGLLLGVNGWKGRCWATAWLRPGLHIYLFIKILFWTQPIFHYYLPVSQTN